MENQEAKPVSLQHIVDLIGNHIVIDNLDISKSVYKAYGEVEIQNQNFQIQIVLVPNKKDRIPGKGVHQKAVGFFKRLFN